jgi:DNA polymerase III delta prime subunit
MSYNFANLSPADFEDLVRDLIGRHLRLKFEAFTAGPDGGMDGRHAQAGRSTILQAKHYVGSQFASFKAAMKRERAAIEKLDRKTTRYILATSRGLTPANKASLKGIIGPLLKRQSDIFSAGDLNGLIREFPEVESANIKLWLTGTGVLDRVLRSAVHAFTAITRTEIEAKVSLYAQNPSFKEARDKLEKTHVVIISGPPGVGKTMLAEMLAYAYIGEEWEFEAIRSLDEGFGSIKDAKKQIFFFDDFLGQIALDARALSTKDSDLARFIRRIRNTPNGRFVLTTRAPVFEEARQVSEHLRNPALDILKYVLDVGVYTRRIRARILYNHLFVTKTPSEFTAMLWTAGAIKKIIDHPNYNPRIVEWMTDSLRIKDIQAKDYPAAFLAALDNPHQLWDTSFRKHIPPKCRHLLFCLFFGSEYGTELDDLKQQFLPLHAAFCKAHNLSHDPKDFEESLKILESGFITITGTRVSFINPSLRDYLSTYLDDETLLGLLASVARKADWAAAVWSFVRAAKTLTEADITNLVREFIPAALTFNALPVMKPDPARPNVWRYHDLGLARRIELLLEWYSVTEDGNFADQASLIANSPFGGFSNWQDGRLLLRTLVKLKKGEESIFSFSSELANTIEAQVIGMLEGFIWADDLDALYGIIEQEREALSEEIFLAASRAVTRSFENAMEDAASVESRSTLEDEISALERLGLRTGIDKTELDKAISHYRVRISAIEDTSDEAEAPQFSGKMHAEDRFTDAALRDLFAPLVADAIGDDSSESAKRKRRPTQENVSRG